MGSALFFAGLGAAAVLLVLAVRRRFASFSGQRIASYAGASPQFDMRAHLAGPMACEGVIFGPLGRVSSTFCADFDITWEGDTCTMKEVFRYDDGSVQNREWRIALDGRGGFQAWADDVPGSAKGRIAGPAVIFTYPIKMPADAGGHVLQAFDCMYLTENGTVVNRSQFRKFGFKVAELVATIRKKEAV